MLDTCIEGEAKDSREEGETDKKGQGIHDNYVYINSSNSDLNYFQDS